MSDVERMAAEWACERLVRKFAMLNDDRDHEGLAALFTEDGSFSRPLDPDNPIVGRDNIMVMFRDRPPRLSRHIMTNSVIDIASSTEARGRSYLTFVSSTDVDSPRPVKAEPAIHVGQYDDVFVLTDKGWRFKERRGSLSLTA
jgi:hypothetical protein